MKLILFDIDGTLVHVEPEVTREALRDVVRRGLEHDGDLGEVELHGKTDRQIIMELCNAVGCSGEEAQRRSRRMEEILMEHWRARLNRDTVQLLPGVRDLLDRLVATDGVRLGLLTGNVEAGARMKLAPHGLNDYFPFGAFGCDAVQRNELPPIALERARALDGTEFAYERTLIIGDSHRDIACARAWGIRALAVATGALTLEDLLGHEPDSACSTLLESDYIFEFIEQA